MKKLSIEVLVTDEGEPTQVSLCLNGETVKIISSEDLELTADELLSEMLVDEDELAVELGMDVISAESTLDPHWVQQVLDGEDDLYEAETQLDRIERGDPEVQPTQADLDWAKSKPVAETDGWEVEDA